MIHSSSSRRPNYCVVFIFSMMFVVIFVYSILVYRDVGAIKDGYESYPEIKGKLKLHEDPADWQTARMLCHDEDTILAVPMMEHKMPAVLTEIMQIEELHALFMGVQISSSEGVYRSSKKGKLVRSLDVADVTPPLDSCSVIYANGTMGFVDCSQRLPFVCYDLEAVQAVAVCGEDPDYELDERTGQCYKFHAQSKAWNDAHYTCLDEGAHLAIVNSETEAQVLMDLFEQYPFERLNGTNIHWGVMAVGFYYWKAADTYITIHGQSIEQAGYAKWSYGNPSSRGKSTELGGGMFRDGLLDDVRKSYEVPFICEKKPLKLQN